MEYLKHYDSPLGAMTMAAHGNRLSGLWFDGQKYDRAGVKEYESAVSARLPMEAAEVFVQTEEWLDLYFAGKEPGFLPPLELTGSEFRQSIAKLMLEIPYGTTATYGQLAQKAARQMGLVHMSAQAVGGAVGHNRISILIPCHRVLGRRGSLTGYAGGTDRKKQLLELEGALLTPVL